MALSMNGLTAPVDTALQDQHTKAQFGRFKLLQNYVTLAAPAVVGSRNLTLAAGHNFTTNDWLSMIEGGIVYQSKCTSIASDPVIQFASPVPYPYTAAVVAGRGTINAAINGSVTPAIFNINPLQTAVWDVTQLVFTIVGDGSMDDSTFGHLAALTNGVIVRKRLNNGIYWNLFEVRTNGGFRNYYGKAEYTPKIGGGSFSFSSIHSFGGQGNVGVVLRLDGRIGEQLEVIIQDNLSTLVNFYITAIGHEVKY